MEYCIVPWKDIAENYYQGTILLGNGASIAVHSKFKYESLFLNAKQENLLSEYIDDLFAYFNTNDFELILRLVWQAHNVNKSLRIYDYRTSWAYSSIRDCLIKSVLNVHSKYDEVSHKLPMMYNFLKNFNMVFSLNYDLLVYWTMTYGINVSDGHRFKDCFLNAAFDDDWSKFRVNSEKYKEKSNTLVFYPHGSLALSRDIEGVESKIHSNGDSLLSNILNSWKEERCVPLFVSEGTAQQKIASIHNSYYLSTVYREVLASKQTALTILGWGIGEQDQHLLQRISRAGIQRVAVSVFGNDQDYCHRTFQTIVKYLGNIRIDFFSSESPECWVYKEDSGAL